jgi:hypothetical protein
MNTKNDLKGTIHTSRLCRDRCQQRRQKRRLPFFIFYLVFGGGEGRGEGGSAEAAMKKIDSAEVSIW